MARPTGFEPVTPAFGGLVIGLQVNEYSRNFNYIKASQVTG